MNILFLKKGETDYLEKNSKYFNKIIILDEPQKLRYRNRKWDECMKIIDDEEIDTLVSSCFYIDYVSRITWECNRIKSYILYDTLDAFCIEKSNVNMNVKMWDLIASKILGGGYIQQAGWKNSFTGEYFTEEEMEEYANDVYVKLEKYCSKTAKVLEIGIASGITCFQIAPYVKEYYGIDISAETLNKTAISLKDRGITNVFLEERDIFDVDKFEYENFDIVIINSVIQYFPGYNYFINVIKKVITLMADKSVLFIGDVMDLDKREDFERELRIAGKSVSKKDLYYSKEFMNELAVYCDEISDIETSDKIGNIKNELIKYRFDALFRIDKVRRGTCQARTPIKRYLNCADGLEGMINNDNCKGY